MPQRKNVLEAGNAGTMHLLGHLFEWDSHIHLCIPILSTAGTHWLVNLMLGYWRRENRDKPTLMKRGAHLFRLVGLSFLFVCVLIQLEQGILGVGQQKDLQVVQRVFPMVQGCLKAPEVMTVLKHEAAKPYSQSTVQSPQRTGRSDPRLYFYKNLLYPKLQGNMFFSEDRRKISLKLTLSLQFCKAPLSKRNGDLLNCMG